MTKSVEDGFFYGWVIVAVSCLTVFVSFGVRLSFTVFFVALVADFGWSRSSTASIFSLNMIIFALSSAGAGLALDRWGAPRVFAAGATLLALGLVLSSRVQSLTQLMLAYGVVVGLGVTVLGLGPQAGFIARWFRRRLGTAIGLTFAGTGLGSLIVVPAVAWLIGRDGWRSAYLGLAGLAVFLIPTILVLLRASPATMGLAVDGNPVPASFPLTIPATNVAPAGWTMAGAMRTPAFWLVIVAGAGAIGPLRMLTVHQLAVALDAGYERSLAALTIGFGGAVTAVAFVIFGALSDRIGRRVTYAIGSGCLLAAIGLLGNLDGLSHAVWLVLYALCLGLGEGSRSSLVTAVASDLFPGPALGAVNGAVGSAFGIGAAVFPWLAGYVFDASGSYSGAFKIAAAAVLVSLLALWLAPWSHPDQDRGANTRTREPFPGAR